MPKGVYDRDKARARKNQKEDIIKAAMKIYAFYGFEGATMERMAAAAGVSKGLILAHFGSKQGLVQEIATRAVRDSLERIREIDEVPGLTLRQRQEQVFSIIRPEREEWCLILGTLLVPNFQFQMRSEMEGFLKSEHKSILRHQDEFKEPGSATAFAFAYSMIGLYQTFILGGKERNFRKAFASQMDLYLLPEEEILEQKRSTSQTPTEKGAGKEPVQSV